MEFFKYTKTFNFMGKSKMAMVLSIVLVLSSLLLLAIKGLNYGVDFAGGTIVQVKYDTTAPIDLMREKLKSNEIFSGASVTEFGSAEEVVIRMKTTTGDVTVDIGDVTREALKDTGNYEIRRVDIVGPKVGSELKEKGITSLLLAVLGILIYVAFRFEWRFALASIIALIHDVSIALGAITLVGLDVNLDVLAALLTILGYSLNDTIIVFDRIREGVTDSRTKELADTINESITRTLARTTLTSLTTFFVVFTLFIFGGEIIHSFAFTLLVGVVVGTYSSIFVASPILLAFGFDVKKYHNKLADKAKREAEKERIRAQYESGVM
ncbi:MAG: protein translocase subunit SecF [Epsilonproteobacteria bacterium]|nr:protein translocase subunit SecF [Campylobacterota bacterium]OIO17438.1 MAG: protein-export membrane protein SecF [Helicobacteraceae bacterium CG1_02_36_14]PIP10679.1 MAG: protein translocase subunit SecF [Sulfurimonas sp. CG23_combo_of_CG06-09_8_20_14_all_36_33]PIS25013.1 MAG: protein translocase subunit SecF [Sulfurimonas sp. CG08_land_8_20_14_0_20_36_33]PIU35143.1 MAG: protein translocase subunit SecF [Sulfurimonas sp. CG07_land_8_20_14_0_80_36_56]PIV03166.1 MAG: protein translocase subu